MSESEAVSDFLKCSKGQQSQQRNMANDLYLQSETDSEAAAAISGGHELDSLLGKAFEEKPIWVGLFESIRDVFFPPKLPPLELTSKPIPVPDRMAVKANPWAIGISTTVNIAIVVVLLFLGVKKIIEKHNTLENVTHVEVTEFIPPKAASENHGGGGSGNKIDETTKGHLPKPELKPITPPVVPKIVAPPEDTIDMQKDIIIPDNKALPNIGLSKSANVRLGGGMGSGGGIGSGHGDGVGPGSGGNFGGGLYKVGGSVAEPKLIFAPEAEFSDEARRAKYQGAVLISVIVDAQGNPQNPRVVRQLGMGLDEKALEAIRKYKFKPALKDGKTPVPVMISILVDFHLY